MRKKINEKGSISELVLFTVLMFATVLAGTYVIVSTKVKAELKSDLQIERIYARDVELANFIDDEKTTQDITKYQTGETKPYLPKEV